MPILETTTKHSMINAVLGVCAGFLFTYIVGSLDTADYLIEQMSIWIIEVPFMILAAVVARKFGWRLFLVFLGTGMLSTAFLTYGDGSIASFVFLKDMLTGLIIGRYDLFAGRFTRRFVAAAFPGVVLSLLIGSPLVMNGVQPEVIDGVRQDTLELYQAFISEEEAVNATDNAIELFGVLFQAGCAFFAIFSIIFAWIAFVSAQGAMKVFKLEREYTPPFHRFKLPFQSIWFFLGGFGLLLLENRQLFPVALNVFSVMAFLYLVQGIAIVMYHMNRFRLGRIPRIIFWLMFLLTIVFTGIVLVLLGLLDTWFDLRAGTPGNGGDKEKSEEQVT